MSEKGKPDRKAGTQNLRSVDSCKRIAGLPDKRTAVRKSRRIDVS
jgi:hypothetical protein